MPSVSAELDDRTRQQVRILLDAAKRFDLGGPAAHDEALNMAIRLRVLLHSGNDESLLKRGGYLGTMQFCNSVGAPADDGSFFMAALQQVINLHPAAGQQHVSFKPAMGHHIKQLTPAQQVAAIRTSPRFEDWWDAVLVRDFDQRAFTRGYIVKKVANQDGGAHVDPKLPGDYLAISRGNGTFGISIRLDNGDEHHAGNAVPALVRQITWELERSLRQTAPTLLGA